METLWPVVLVLSLTALVILVVLSLIGLIEIRFKRRGYCSRIDVHDRGFDRKLKKMLDQRVNAANRIKNSLENLAKHPRYKKNVLVQYCRTDTEYSIYVRINPDQPSSSLPVYFSVLVNLQVGSQHKILVEGFGRGSCSFGEDQIETLLYNLSWAVEQKLQACLTLNNFSRDN